MVMSYWSTDTLFWQLSIDLKMDVQYQVVRSHTSWKVWHFQIGFSVVRTGGHFTTNIPWVKSNQIFLAMGQFSRKRRASVAQAWSSPISPLNLRLEISPLNLRLWVIENVNPTMIHHQSPMFEILCPLYLVFNEQSQFNNAISAI